LVTAANIPNGSEPLARAFGGASVLRSKELEARGISREVLRLATKDGKVERVGRGLYSLPDAAATEHHSLVVAATRVDGARISHLSALAFHGLTTQNPREVWITIPRTMRKPETDALPLRVVRCQSDILEDGAEWHELEGAQVPVYSVARTLVDLFRQRNKLGVDVAIEALREAWRGKRFQLKELNRLADRFRMTRVMKPYLESLLS
jgi:predicted transcriptional regulator of viral defense system